VLEKTETIYPMEITTDDEEEPEDTVEDVKDDEGLVVRRVVRRPVMLTNKVTVVKRSEVLPNGDEKDIEESVVEESPVTVEEPTTKNLPWNNRKMLFRWKAPTQWRVNLKRKNPLTKINLPMLCAGNA